MTLILFLVGVGFFLAIIIAVLVVAGKGQALKEGKKLLEENSQDVKKIDKIVKQLGAFDDAEAIDMVKRLNDLKYKEKR